MNGILSALSIPRKGQVYDLGREISSQMPRMNSDVIMPFSLTTYRSPEDMAKAGDMNGVTFHVEVAQGSFHCSTHLDALVHCQYQGHIHGGAGMAEARGDFGWKEQGAETVPPMVSRGVMLDIPRYRGVRALADGYAVTVGDLEGTVTSQGTVVRAGDTVLLRTGKAWQFENDPEAFVKGCPGVSKSGAVWLAERGMSALAIDSTSADPQPETWEDPAHVYLLVDKGIYIMENVNMEDLSRDEQYEFLFVSLSLKFRGGTGSWIRPIAIA